MSLPSSLRRRPAAPAALAPPAVTGRVLTLPFDVVDEVAAYHDHPSEPNNIHLELRVPGTLDEFALRTATARALADLPRARARRQPADRWQGRSRWEFPDLVDADPVSFTTWSDEADLDRVREEFMAAVPPLTTAPPLRLLIATGPAETCVLLNAHHAALDGLSDIEFLRRLAAHYDAPLAQVTPGREPQPGRAGPDQRADQPTSSPARRPRARTVTRIAPAPDTTTAGYGFQLLPVRPVPATKKSNLASGPLTVNDLLVAALALAIRQWNAAHGWPAGRIRITIPMNTRPPGQERAAGNLTRLATIAVKLPDGTTPPAASLLADIARQTQWWKDHPGPEADRLSSLLVGIPLPAAVKRRLLRAVMRLAGPYLCDTSLVSNLGSVTDPPQFGAQGTSRMAITAPAHMPRGLSVSAITVRGQMQLCLRYRRALLSREAAADFARLYLAALDELTLAVEATGAIDGVAVSPAPLPAP
jgi:NRPS condensation-like uncharacterized protein